MGFINFYRRFIDGFARFIALINRYLKGNKPGDKPRRIVLGKDALEAFIAIKNAF
jgi:hypothetical protein